MVQLSLGLALAAVAASLLWQPWFFKVCQAFMAILAVVVAAIVGLQRRLIWPAQRANGIIIADLRTESPKMEWGELIRLRPGVVAAFKPPPPKMEKKKVVVFFHGNGDNIAYLAPSLGYVFGRLGCGFCAVEYPGYGYAAEGTSQGPTESGVYAAAEEVLLHLETAKGIKRKQVVLAGQSIGCGVAVEMAARGFGCGLVLVSPFTSLRAVVAGVVSDVLSAIPLLPRPLTHRLLLDVLLPLVLRDELDNAAKVGGLFKDGPHPPSAPTPAPRALVLSGTLDTLVPHEQSRDLASRFAAEACCQFVPMAGKGHNDVWDWAGDDGKAKGNGLAGRIATFALAL